MNLVKYIRCIPGILSLHLIFRRMVVSPEQIKIFQENGAILLKQVFSAEQVEMVKCGIQVFIYIIMYI